MPSEGTASSGRQGSDGEKETAYKSIADVTPSQWMQPRAPKLRDLIRPNPPIACPSDTVRDAADLMSKAKISAISVQADGRLVGVLTDSDITEKIVAPGLDAASVTVGELMDPDPVRISDDRDIESAALVMQARGARSLVVQDLLGRFVGLLTDCELCQVVHGRSPEAIQ